MRKLMGENLKLIQYDENAMILHVLSLALLLLIGLLIPADMIVGGSAAYDHKKKGMFLTFSICVSVFYFISMLLITKIFNTIINRAT